ncbi:DNA primase, partial [bacterium]|nr:DNA primase [bacterium]
VVVIAGEPNAGKTAYLLNVVRMNMARHDIHYFTSEMGAAEFRKRLSNFSDVALDDWRFNPRERSTNFADVIRPDAVNIIDYLEIHEDFYRLGGQIKAVFDRLRKGIAVIALQKNLNTDIGRGGIATLEKPRLYLAMKPGALTIVKGKNWASRTNPNGLSSRFRIINGARFDFGEWVRN